MKKLLSVLMAIMIVMSVFAVVPTTVFAQTELEKTAEGEEKSVNNVNPGDRGNLSSTPDSDVSNNADQYEESREVCSDNHIQIGNLGATFDMPKTAIENNVKSIELVKATEHKYIENAGGGIDTRYNEETKTDEEFYCYSIYDIQDVIIKINYKDGSSKTANVCDWVDGYYVSYESNQYDKPWKVGSDNYIQIEYLGATVDMPITIEENKVKSIELIKGTKK